MIRDFMRINPPTFHGTKVIENPQNIIDEIFKEVDGMGVALRGREKLSTYEINDVSQLWFYQPRDEIPLREGLVDW